MSNYPPPLPMGEGPGFQPPTLGYATPPQGIDLSGVATYQRALNLCILAEIFIGLIKIGLGWMPFASSILFVAYVGVAIAAAVNIFKLSLSLYGTGLGVVFGILVLVPLLGLIVLLIVNGKATKLLRKNGIKVGLLGADPATISPGGGPYPPAHP